MPPNVGDLEHILALSEDQARILGHGFIGTEHILLGLIVEERGVAAEVLATFDVTLELVRSKVREIIEVAVTSTGGSLPQTPRASRAIHCAREEVVVLGHISVGSGHVLLGLITEGQGVAMRVLDDLGVDLRQLRVATLRAMGVGDR